jgi:hypothetical protein
LTHLIAIRVPDRQAAAVDHALLLYSNQAPTETSLPQHHIVCFTATKLQKKTNAGKDR